MKKILFLTGLILFGFFFWGQDGQAATKTWQVGASGDDVVRYIDSLDILSSNDTWLVGSYSGYNAGAGARFTNITIPQGSTINEAYLILHGYGYLAQTVFRSRISAEKVDDAPTFTNSKNVFDSRWANRTAARVDWDNSGAWWAEAQSPDIKTVIQEIINRAGWVRGNDIVIFHEDFEHRSDQNALRQAASWDIDPAWAPKLVVTYSSAGAVPTVTTQDATGVSIASSTGNGNITVTGVDKAYLRGVRWGTVSGVYDNTSTESGDFSTGAFTQSMTGLSPGTTYYYQAIAQNSAGWGFGLEKSFTTTFVPDGCISLVGSGSCVNSKIAVALTWPPLTQPDINAVRSDCTLSSATYRIAIIGLGSVDVGGSTSYIWSGLDPSTNYNWKVTSSYQCTFAGYYGTMPTNIYSITTPGCNSSPNNPTFPSSPTTWDNCIFQGKSIPTFHWIYNDPDNIPPGADLQTAYEVEVDDNASFQSPKFNYIANSGSLSYALDLNQDTEGDWLTELDWQTSYHWRVRVRDSHNNWSGWSNQQQFQTPNEAYPYSGFSWEPQDPNQGEVVIFTPDTLGVSYLWTITAGSGTFVDSTGPTSQNPHIIFNSRINKITLQATEGSYSCTSAEYEIRANLPLPEYKEVPPLIYLQKALAALFDFFHVF